MSTALGHDVTVRATARLSPIELAVLYGAADGLTRQAIGRRHGISENTVKTHLQSINGKLGASNATHAVAIAFRNKIIR